MLAPHVDSRARWPQHHLSRCQLLPTLPVAMAVILPRQFDSEDPVARLHPSILATRC